MINSTLLLSPKDLVGDSDTKFKMIKNLFKVAKQETEHLKIILVEDIDFICQSKGDLIYTFLSELDDLKVSEKVLVIATTALLDKTDKALRRGGRLDLDIRIDMPDETDRFLIMKEHLS